MTEEAKPLDTEAGGKIIIYEGFLTQLVTNKLNLSVPYYTKCRQALMAMGCIKQLRRGGGTSPSQWELVYRPSLDNFTEAVTNPATAAKSALAESELSTEELFKELFDELNNRVASLESWQQDVNHALADFFGKEPQS